MDLIDRLKAAWNLFTDTKQDYSQSTFYGNLGYGYNYRPDRVTLSIDNEKSIVTAVYERIAIDCADILLKHVITDGNGRYIKDVDSLLNRCLTMEANKDQTSRAFIYDLVFTMLNEGLIVAAPIDVVSGYKGRDNDIKTIRIGKVTDWYPDFVRIDVYNDRTGIHEPVLIEKKKVAIIENPFFAVMNSSNSTGKRLINKLNMLDSIDKQSSSGKLDLIVQVPYSINTQARREQAKQRRAELVDQLNGSTYGIAYTDGTEKIVQLNRPVDNNLLTQVQYLTDLLFSQLGVTSKILDGTADESTMTNYRTRVVDVIMSSVAEEFKRKFLSDKNIDDKETIRCFNNILRTIPASKVGDSSDSLSRNAILSSNEIRDVLGLPPSNDPEADKLTNHNMPDTNKVDGSSTK